ncbi:heme A synthase [Halobacteriaceae archaeon GCM10025711]
MRLRFRHLAAFTTFLTGLLILLGVYTAASGSGAACGLDWPFCNGRLLPLTASGQLDLPSFIEWFHRLVAMVAGFFILGTVAGAWRNYDGGHIRWTAVLALVFTPVQIILGAMTVRVDLFPFAYSPAVQTIHHAAAMLIFAFLLLATVWIYDADGAGPTAG